MIAGQPVSTLVAKRFTGRVRASSQAARSTRATHALHVFICSLISPTVGTMKRPDEIT